MVASATPVRCAESVSSSRVGAAVAIAFVTA